MKLERENQKYNQYVFARSISKLSKTQVVIIKSQNDLNRFLKKNSKYNEIIIGMGAGSISKWMKSLKTII